MKSKIHLTLEQFEIALYALKRTINNGDDTMDVYSVKAQELGCTRYEAKQRMLEEVAYTGIWHYED